MSSSQWLTHIITNHFWILIRTSNNGKDMVKKTYNHCTPFYNKNINTTTWLKFIYCKQESFTFCNTNFRRQLGAMHYVIKVQKLIIMSPWGGEIHHSNLSSWIKIINADTPSPKSGVLKTFSVITDIIHISVLLPIFAKTFNNGSNFLALIFSRMKWVQKAAKSTFSN